MVIKPGRSSNLRTDLWNDIQKDMNVRDKKFYELMRIKSHSSKVSLSSAKLLPIRKGIEFFIEHASDNSRYMLLSDTLASVFNFTYVIIGEESLTTDGMTINSTILYSRECDYTLEFSSIIKFKKEDSKILYINIPPTLSSLTDVNNIDNFLQELITRIYAEFYFLERKVSLYNSIELFYTFVESVSFLFTDVSRDLSNIAKNSGIVIKNINKYIAIDYIFPEQTNMSGPLEPLTLYQQLVVGKVEYINKFIGDIVNNTTTDSTVDFDEHAIYNFNYKFPIFENDISSFIYQLDLIPLYLYAECYGAKLYRGNIYNKFRRQLNMSYSRFSARVMYLSSNKRKVVSMLEYTKNFQNNRYETMIENILYTDDEVRNLIKSFYNYIK